MILTHAAVAERINSPDNLLNRLAKSTSRIVNNLPNYEREKIIDIPSFPTSSSSKNNREAMTIDELIDDVETKIELGQSHIKAVRVLNLSLDQLEMTIPSEEHPEKLAKIASSMSKIISDSSPKSNGEDGNKSQIIIWKPFSINIDEMKMVHAVE